VENFCERLATVGLWRATFLHPVGVDSSYTEFELMVFTRPLYLFYMVFGKRLHFRIPNLLSWQTWLEKFWDAVRYISLSLSLSLPCLLLTITAGCFSISESGTFFLYSSFDVMKYWPIFEARWIWNCVAIGRLIHDNGPRGTVSHVPAENFCRIKCASGKYKHGQYTRVRRVVTPPLAGLGLVQLAVQCIVTRKLAALTLEVQVCI